MPWQRRPFVLEVKEPKRWDIDYETAMKTINEQAGGSIEITDVRRSNRSEVVRVKDTPAEKSYTIRFVVEPLTQPELDVLTAPLDLTKEDVQQRVVADGESIVDGATKRTIQKSLLNELRFQFLRKPNLRR